MKKLLIFIPFLLFGEILSPLQKALLDKDLNKVIVSGDKLKDSWINPITMQYKYNQTNQTPTIQKTNSFVISVNQPIFKSGAIYQSLKYANFLKEENLKKVELQKRTLIKQVYEILFNIKKLEIDINKQKLLIDNANIDIERKREQFLSGVSDSSFLDNAIINKNNLELALNDLLFQKQTLINNFKDLSNANYKKVTLPKLSLISKNEYLKNLNVKIAKKDINVKKALKYMNIGNSLLSINLIANWNYMDIKYNNPTPIYQNNEDSFYNIGISFTIPLNINSIKTIQESKIDYLKSILSYKDSVVKAQNEYNTQIKSIQTIDKKITIYKNSIKVYNSLIKTTKDNIKAGVNTILDLKNLKNSKAINELNIQDLKIQKQIKLLDLLYLVKDID